MIELVAAVGDHPFGDGFFNIIHEGLSHHVETEEEAKQGEKEGVRDVDTALEVEGMLGWCVLPEAVGHLTPSLHEDLVDIHFPAYKGAEVAFEFRAFDCVPSEGELVKGVLTVAQGAEDDCFGEVDEGSGHSGVSVDGLRNRFARADFGVDDREVVRKAKGFDLVDLLQAVEQGVHDYREEDWGEGAALFQAVGHFDPDSVFLCQDGAGFHLGVQSTNDV